MSYTFRYIYTENITSVSSDLYFELYYVANKYMLLSLQKKCIELLTLHINSTNACRAYEFAQQFEESSLMAHCLNVLQDLLSKPYFYIN